MIQHSHLYGYIQRNATLVTPEAPAHPFISALFTTAKLWKQPRCPTTDEWIKKMWFIRGLVFDHMIKREHTREV
jgi:hypothetical protein